MPVARSTKYPNLKMRNGVRFRGGVAEVTVAQAEMLAAQKPRLGIVVEDYDLDGEDEPAEDAPPPGNASREAWAAYAEEHYGIDPEGLGRDDIKAAVAAAEADPDPQPVIPEPGYQANQQPEPDA